MTKKTKTLLLALLGAALLALPSVASAHGGKHHHWGWHHAALYAKLSGTGTLASANGTIASTKLGTGTFTSAVTTTGAATTKTFHRGTLSCSPATATVTLVGSSTVTATLTGKSCTWTPAGSTTSSAMFWGRGADVNGAAAKGFLAQKSDGTVKGAIFAGHDEHLMRDFSVRLKHESHHTGDCDRH
jgi:hypothetical protein